MPAGNGTGPAGLGPMTGRAAGLCAGYSAPGYANPAGGRGFFGNGRGCGGGGRGWRNRFYATGLHGWDRRNVYPGSYGYGGAASELTREAEAKILKEQADFMQKEISAIHNRIKEIESLSSGEK